MNNNKNKFLNNSILNLKQELQQYGVLAGYNTKQLNSNMWKFLEFIKKFSLVNNMLYIAYFEDRLFIKKLLEFSFLFERIKIKKLKIAIINTSTDVATKKIIRTFCQKNKLAYFLGNWQAGFLTANLPYKTFYNNLLQDSSIYWPYKPDFIILFNSSSQNSEIVLKEIYDSNIPIIGITNASSDPRISFILPSADNSAYISYFYCKVFEYLLNSNNELMLNFKKTNVI